MERNSYEIEDEILVLGCKRGEQAAWNALVARWNKRLFYFVRRLVDDEHDAANVLQETWINVIKSLPSLRDGSRSAPWMYTIARRAAMKHLRVAYSTLEEQDDVAIDGALDTNELLNEFIDNADMVHHVLTKLCLPHREILTLYFLQDLSIAEIASVLDVAAGTVKSRLFHARKSFREVLNSEVNNESDK